MAIKKKIMLVCSECHSRNYSKNKSNDGRLILKKHCNNCKKHTEHKEDK